MAMIDDPEFAPPSALAFPAGTSPFRQKGNAYLGDIRYLNDRVPGGFAAVVAALPDPALRSFFSQTFRGGEWYDAYPGSQLEVAAARLRKITFERHRRETGGWHAEHAAAGLYGALLRFISTESVALWGPRISSLYFEFGNMETRVTGPRDVLAIRRGIPKELAQWLMFAAAGFTQATLRLAGAPDPSTTIHDVEPDGSRSGRDLVKVQLRMQWR